MADETMKNWLPEIKAYDNGDGTWSISVRNGSKPVVTPATGTGNINESTAMTGAFELVAITIHFSAATSNPVVVSLDALDGVAYDTVLNTIVCVTVTDVFWLLDEPLPCEAGDQIRVTWTNDAAYTYGLRIVTREV